MLTGYSTGRPDTFITVGDKIHFVYNVERQAKTEDRAALYAYEFVEVSSIDRKTLIDALITARYDYPSQLGKLALTRTSTEWQEYNAFRQACYSLVDEALAKK
jgi:hypothetical protein